MTDHPLAATAACVFDAYGTLFDLASASRRCSEALGGKADALSALWRTKQLEYSWLRSLMGRHADFWQVTGEALDYALAALDIAAGGGLRERLMNAFLEHRGLRRCARRARGAAPRQPAGLHPLQRLAAHAHHGGRIRGDRPAPRSSPVGRGGRHLQARPPRLSARSRPPRPARPRASASSRPMAGTPPARPASASSSVWANRAGAPRERLPAEPHGRDRPSRLRCRHCWACDRVFADAASRCRTDSGSISVTMATRCRRALPLLCLTGLVRNSADFADVAERHAGERRVIAPDYRGRGRSDYDSDWRNYDPLVYVNDLAHLIAAAGLQRLIVLGTSLGGALAMGLAVMKPTALGAVVLNDFGPEVVPGGHRPHPRLCRQRPSAARLAERGPLSAAAAADTLDPHRERLAQAGAWHLPRGRGRPAAFRLGRRGGEAAGAHRRHRPRSLALFPRPRPHADAWRCAARCRMCSPPRPSSAWRLPSPICCV